MAKITLCGSAKFKEYFEDWDKILTLYGHIVYSIPFLTGSKDELTIQEKTLLDKVHMLKIDNSDEIFVLDVNNYIGDSTRRQIEYAKTKNKKITYLSEIEK